MGCLYSKTKDGFELQMGTNHFGHFYLTKLLLPRLYSSRIVNVSSVGHFLWEVPCDASHYAQMCNPNTYHRWYAYSLSKSANILFTRELQRRYSVSHQIRSYSLHPGGVNTQLDRHMDMSNLIRTLAIPIRYLIFKTPLEGAQTNLYCALSDQAKPGAYHADCQPTPVLNKYVENDDIAQAWWDYSEKVINEKLQNIEDK
jgi:NAD(P)-dependent dehydrogenase (short-subunit alcohol dehydrogenase family)